MYLTVLLGSIGILIFLFRKIRVGEKDERFYEMLGKFNSLPSYYPIIGNAHLLYGSLESKRVLMFLMSLTRNRRINWCFWFDVGCDRSLWAIPPSMQQYANAIRFLGWPYSCGSCDESCRYSGNLCIEEASFYIFHIFMTFMNAK